MIEKKLFNTVFIRKGKKENRAFYKLIVNLAFCQVFSYNKVTFSEVGGTI